MSEHDAAEADTVVLRSRLTTEFQRYNMDFPGDRAKAAQRAFEAFTATLRALAREWQSSDLMDAAAWLEGTL